MAPERWPQSTDQASREQFGASEPVMRGGVIMIYVEAENTKHWGNVHRDNLMIDEAFFLYKTTRS